MYHVVPVATRTAVGPANPNAQGHALTHTDKQNKLAKNKKQSASSYSPSCAISERYQLTGTTPASQAVVHITKVRRDIPATAGTKY
jgi:hypothetical protein